MMAIFTPDRAPRSVHLDKMPSEGFDQRYRILINSSILSCINPSMWPHLSSPFERFFVFPCLSLVSTASHLVSIRLAHTRPGGVRERVSFSPHPPRGFFGPLCTAYSSLTMALALYPCSGEAWKIHPLLGASPPCGLCT